jgi:hypothetical protein
MATGLLPCDSISMGGVSSVRRFAMSWGRLYANMSLQQRPAHL